MLTCMGNHDAPPGDTGDHLENVRELLREREISQVKLAEILGVSRMTVHRRLTGKRGFTVNELLILAHHFDISVADLFE